MRRFVDLHCHFIAGIDDGAPSPAEGVAILAALGALGFEHVVATPHMRPGMFENTREDLERAFAGMGPHLAERPDLPRVSLSSEHYFDAIVFSRLLDGTALPYPGGRAALLEFYEIDFPPTIEHRFFDLQRKGILPVIAHPERYRVLWQKPERLERLVDKGAAALLDTAALVGKYGRKPQSCAEHLLELGLYHAACSDAHRSADVAEVAEGMRRIEKRYGADEIEFLFCDGPRSLLEGHLPE
jgi:protein-tyrosine phosphatase